MKQRMAIARALLHDPPILLMDEPTRSLDPSSQLGLRRFILDELSGRDQKTILLATHNLREAEVLCERAAIVAAGRIVRIGTVDEIRDLGLDGARYRFHVDRWPDGLAGPFRELESEPLEGGVRVTIALDAGADLGGAIEPILAAGTTLRSCERSEPDLEDAFARIVKDAGDAAGESS
jgi:ABC-2 type transport system ATP-binding protein